MQEGEIQQIPQIPEDVALKQIWRRVSMFFADISGGLKSNLINQQVANDRVRIWLKTGGFDFLRKYLTENLLKAKHPEL